MPNNITLPAFSPSPAGTVSVSASTTSSNVQIQTGNLFRHVRVTNAGTATAFVKFGDDNSVAASKTADVPVLGGVSVIFSAPVQYAAAVMASGTATVYFTPGEGN